MDLYGIVFPPKDIVFPHLAGKIHGFDKIDKFDQYQQHHIIDPDNTEQSYDITCYSIVRFFFLLLDNNPNVVDSIFTPHSCILHCTQVGNLIRENRKIFLHKGIFHRLKGYAYAQLAKMTSKEPELNSKRQKLRDEFGFDVKYGMHICRLVMQCEQILTTHDLDLTQNSEQLKAIRRGEWTEQQIRDFFTQKEKSLEDLHNKSDLRHSPDVPRIKQLLLTCLEAHYGNLDKVIVNPDKNTVAIQQIREILSNLQ
jgi:predicted nucleotidyltransferase